MGTNRRYGSDLTWDAVNAFLVRPRPISLTDDELAGQDVVEVPDGEPVQAWVRYSEAHVQVSARVVAYTARAVQVEYTQRDGAVFRVWVWRGAVTKGR